eukprot:1185102-Prorocentrum_minimum.AAC.3
MCIRDSACIPQFDKWCRSTDRAIERLVRSEGTLPLRNSRFSPGLLADGFDDSGGEREYTHSGHQWQKGRENIPKADTNGRRGERIYP